MKTEIQTSLDWQMLRAKLKESTNKFSGVIDFSTSNDILWTYCIIDRLISDLSKEEVSCRQQKRQSRKHKELVELINSHIAQIDQTITFLSLLHP